jgi:hypothetical protein
MTARLTPDDLTAWRRALREADEGKFLDATVAQQRLLELMSEVELLWAERDRSKAELLVQTAAVLEARLADLARRGPPNAPGYGCAMCRDAEARSFISYLRATAVKTGG